MTSRLQLLAAAALGVAALAATYAIGQDRATAVPGMNALLENECVACSYPNYVV